MTPRRPDPRSARHPGHDGQVLPFRRGPAARRRRRNPWLALLAPLGGALGVVLVPLSLAGWLLTSPRFALRQVVVEGSDRVAPSWVERTLQPLVGRHLLQVSLGEARRLLAGHPWLEAVELRRELPARLRVRLSERRPAALLRAGELLYYVDAAGRRIALFDPRLGPGDLVLLSTSGDADLEPALALAAALAGVAPDWARELSEVEVLGDEGFRLYTAALPFPVLVRAAGLERQVRDLRRLLPEIERRYPALEAVDLRFPSRIVLQPAVPRRERAGEAPPPPPPAAAARVAA